MSGPEEVIVTEAVFEDSEAEDRLAQLGVPRSALLVAVAAGEMARATCTENDPLNFPGLIAWAKTTRALREEMSPLGWSAVNDRNLPIVLSPDGELAIFCSSGDDGVGVGDTTPQTKNKKGMVTICAISRNCDQLSLPFDPPVAVPPGKLPERSTWVLLVHRNATELRAELSFPAAVDEAGRVVGWAERIILGSIDLGGADIVQSPEQEPPVTIPVQRKSG